MFKRRKVVDQSLESSVLQDLKASLLQAIAKDVPQEENQASFSTRSGPFPELGMFVCHPPLGSTLSAMCCISTAFLFACLFLFVRFVNFPLPCAHG
jgi:hypothetical protein